MAKTKRKQVDCYICSVSGAESDFKAASVAGYTLKDGRAYERDEIVPVHEECVDELLDSKDAAFGVSGGGLSMMVTPSPDTPGIPPSDIVCGFCDSKNEASCLIGHKDGYRLLACPECDREMLNKAREIGNPDFDWYSGCQVFEEPEHLKTYLDGRAGR